MKELTIIKVGGKVVEHDESYEKVLKDFNALPSPKLLVHGGGNIATEMAGRLGLEVKMVDGRRVTDAEMLELVTMVYGGLVNKKIVADLQALGCDSIGLTGADMNLLKARRRPARPVDYGFVGDITEVNAKGLSGIIEQGFTPVIAPLSHDQEGQLFNTNADTIASELAIALARFFNVRLVFCFDKKGVLLDASDENSVVKKLDNSKYKELIDKNIIVEGMIPKLESSFNALRKGVKRVFVADIHSIARGGEGGTEILDN